MTVGTAATEAQGPSLDDFAAMLDESFGALDPVTADACLRCALDRAPSLLVIAHP